MSTSTRHRAPRPATTPLVEIVVTEELTAPAAARLHTLLGDALALRPAELIVDLAGCPSADALALDILLNAHRRAFHLGTRLVLRAPTGRFVRVLELAHLGHAFEIRVSPATTAPPRRRRPTAVAAATP